MPALDLEEDNNTTTRLLTLLNVSALKSSKRQRTGSIEPTPRVILNKRRSVQPDTTETTSAAPEGDEGKSETPLPDATGPEETAAVAEDVEDDHGTCAVIHCKLSANGILEEKQDPYEEHFGAQSSHLTPISQGSMERNSWKITRSNWKALGSVTESAPEGSSLPTLPTNGNPVTVRMFPINFDHGPLQPIPRFCRDLKSNSSVPNRS